MASLISRPNGHYWLQLRVGHARRTIRLGKTSRRSAETVKTKIEALQIAAELGIAPDVETATWLARCGPVLRRRIAAADLEVSDVVRAEATLGAFCEAFLSDYSAGGRGTKLTLGVSYAHLRSHFGDEVRVRAISERDAQGFRRAMEEAEYAEATIATDIKKIRQLWSEAVARGLADKNVWSAIRAGDQRNPNRAHFISHRHADLILAACPTAEWQLIFVLCRYGGLRFPSEVMKLTLRDLDWDRGRFKVRGKGKRDRFVPIFPELRLHFEKLTGPPNAPLVVEHRGMTGTACRWRFEEIVAAAGLEQWPRLFHNLRASRQTELENEGYPSYVVAAWLGNSEEVARRHYLQVTDEHFERASGTKQRKAK